MSNDTYYSIRLSGSAAQLDALLIYMDQKAKVWNAWKERRGDRGMVSESMLKAKGLILPAEFVSWGFNVKGKSVSRRGKMTVYMDSWANENWSNVWISGKEGELHVLNRRYPDIEISVEFMDEYGKGTCSEAPGFEKLYKEGLYEEEEFFERCVRIYDGVRNNLPEIASHLKPKQSKRGAEGWWCSIFGRNDQSRYPKFWEKHVSTYFIARSIQIESEWKVGLHFCPTHQVRWRGDVYRDDVIKMLHRHHLQEEFRFVHKPDGTPDFRIEVVMRVSESDVEKQVRTKLAWLIKTTWPEIQTILDAHRL